MIVKKVYDEIDGQMVHTNWCLYADEFNCIPESLEYALYLKIKRKRDIATINAKMTSLKYWYDYIDGLSKTAVDFFTSVEQANFYDYLDRIENKMVVKKIHLVGSDKYKKGFTPSTVNRHIANIKLYYKYLAANEYIPDEPIRIPFNDFETPKKGIKSKRMEHKLLPEYLTVDEVTRILDACNTLRDKTIVLMMLTVGLREGEVCALTTNCMDYSKNRIRMNMKYLDLENGTLKTGPRNLQGNKLLFKLLSRYYILERNRIATCENIFINLQSSKNAPIGSPLTKSGVKALFRRLRIKTGIENCHAHILRHTYATNFIKLIGNKDKVSIGILQKLMGHKNINTTMIYTHLDFSDLDSKMGDRYNEYMEKTFGDLLI
jgi:integrase